LVGGSFGGRERRWGKKDMDLRWIGKERRLGRRGDGLGKNWEGYEMD
jgi:hypothetical protein